nr:reverse transcriptase domain-containing protein [Tanacetum cinerariifolium]
LTAYTQRFQELILLCTRMVPDEKNKVEIFIGGLPDNIQGNVIAAKPTKLQDAIRIANNLMDQKLKGYARSAENKRRLEKNPRDNHGQQSVYKQQNVRGQNVARAYTIRNNEGKGYVGSFPYCNKCSLHHEGSCIVRYGNCKRVAHQTRDYRSVAVALNTQRAAVGDQPGIPGHPFDIDLMTVELGSFDVIIVMDWMAKNQAVIVCDEKVICISYEDEVLIIQSYDIEGRSKSKSNIIPHMKIHKYIEKGCQVYLA